MEINNNIWSQAQKFNQNEALEWESVMNIAEDLEGKNVLDFGCGAGRDLIAISVTCANIYGIDLLQSNISAAIKKFSDSNLVAEFKQLDENNAIQYENNFFDFIMSNGVLHHIKDVDFVMSELYRVIKPGGIMYIMLYTEDLFLYHLNSIENMLKNMPEKTWQRCFGELTDKCNYSTFYSVTEALRLFIAHRFQLIEARNYHNNQFRIYKVKCIKREVDNENKQTQ